MWYKPCSSQHPIHHCDYSGPDWREQQNTGLSTQDGLATCAGSVPDILALGLSPLPSFFCMKYFFKVVAEMTAMAIATATATQVSDYSELGPR